MLERNTLIEPERASDRRIAELEGDLAKKKARVAQLKANYDSLKNEYDNLRAQTQYEIQDLSNSFNQFNFQMSTAKASVVSSWWDYMMLLFPTSLVIVL